METGERGKRMNFYSSGLRPPVSGLLFIFLLYSISLPAVDLNKAVFGLSSGVTVDLAPFGIEQIYFTTQGLYTFPGTVALSLRPSVSIANSSNMFRIPFVINYSRYVGKKEFILISGYLGGGLEFYRSNEHNTESPLLTGGITIAVGNFYLDIPVLRAYRSYNTDSDIGITVGFYFQR